MTRLFCILYSRRIANQFRSAERRSHYGILVVNMPRERVTGAKGAPGGCALVVRRSDGIASEIVA
jgi:hypothetical protein